nr:BamA/TamA family outer membrane protein [bacterium]
ALQGRGYFYPEFENKGESVIVRPGAKTKVKSVSVDGSPPSDFRVDRRRGIRGAILTPSLLNSCEKWAQGQLKSDGYACPRVSSSARADTGDIVLHLEPGEQMKIFDVDEGELEGLRPGTLRRFDAFRLGDTYDYRKLTLTTRRIEEDGIFQSSHFRTECTPDGALLKQQNIVGPTRLFSIGFGANSEDYFVVKATWKMARLGKNGSSFMVTGWGTYRKQNITLQGRLYPLPFPSRWHLNPSLTNRNVNESRYRYTAIDVFVPPAVTWESNSAHFRAAFGPKLNFTHTYSGAARGMTHFLSASARFDVTSHDFEYNILDPVKGYTVSAGVDLNHDSIISSITAQQLTLKGQALWSIDGFDPPLFILAVRGQAGTTIVNDNSASFARLPPQFLYYLGGSQDVRGFSRKQLPAADRGALTSLYAGVELRIANILPLNIQPIIFADFAAMGQRSLRLDFPAYWSPGLGIRWPSIVGTLRLNAAHGYLINDKSALAGRPGGWQYYISLGEEF